jgi:hypothetical protein
MPDPARLKLTLRRAIQHFQETPGRSGRFIQLQDVDEVFIAGDLHGQIANFKEILTLADLKAHPRRHLVIQEVVHGPYRYTETGGDQSHRMLDLIAALKCTFPSRVHMLVGNHELAQWTNRKILKGNEDVNELFRIGVDTAYGEDAAEIYQLYGEMVMVMPLAIRTPNRVFLSHTLPNADWLQNWNLDSIKQDEYPHEAIKYGGYIYAICWGRDVEADTVRRYLEIVDADLLISGHIPCSGHLLPNPQQLILDCKARPAGCCLFSTLEPLTQAQLVQGVITLPPLPGADKLNGLHLADTTKLKDTVS